MDVMAEAGTQQYRQELIAHPRALAGIRRIVGAHLRYWGCGQLAEPVTLCVHELLSNVDKHTGSPECGLLLQRRSDGVRVVVSDTSTVLPKVREPDWIAESGRGLFVLNEMADAWGVVPRAMGKDVWFEIRSRVTSAEVAA